MLALGACSTNTADTSSAEGLALNPAFTEPVVLHSVDGLLEVHLTAEQSTARLNTVAEPVSGMLLFSWDLISGESSGETSGSNSYPAPTLVVQPGDRLVLRVENRLSDMQIDDLVDPVLTPAGDQVPPTPHILESMPINLHTHGLHVSPNINSDNVMIEFDPGQANTYTYDIPADHPQGLFWYHPHRHQLTEEQVYRGLVGMLVVGSPDGGLAKVSDNGLPVRLMALQGNLVANRAEGMHDLNYPAWTQMINTWATASAQDVAAGTYTPIAAPVNFPDSPQGSTFKTNWFSGPLSAENKRGAFQFMPQNLIDFTSDDPAKDSPADPSMADYLRDYQITVNGQFQPRLSLAPGQTEIWVIGNFGSQAYMNVGIRNTGTGELIPLRVLATDGNTVPEVITGQNDDGTTFLLPPASRIAVAVTMPASGSLQLELPPVEGPQMAHTQPLETEGVLYVSNGDGSNPTGTLGRVSIAPENVNWFDGFKSTPTQVLATAAPEGAAMSSVDFAVGEGLGEGTEFQDLAARQVDVTRTFTIGGGSSPQVSSEDPNGFMYMFQGTTWPTTPVIHPRLNSVEEWRFVNTNNDQHPIHVHVNDFEIVKTVDPVQGLTTGPLPYAVDNFNVPAPTLDANDAAITPGEMWLRSTFTDFLGTFVTHCHRLDHEDNGLMMTINVIPAVSTVAIAEIPTGGGAAEVKVLDQADGHVLGTVVPFPGSTTLPSLDMADVDGDGVLDLIAGQGPGGAPNVVVLSGSGTTPFTQEIARFDAFEAEFTGGVAVTAGAIVGDPTKNNLIVSSGPGRRNEIRVFSSELPSLGATPDVVSSFSPAEGDGGAVVAAGLVAPGRVAIAAAANQTDAVGVYAFPLFAGAGHHGDAAASGSLGLPEVLDTFDAFEGYSGPVSLATGWVAADEGGAESIILGQASGAGQVRVFSWASNLEGQSAMYVEDFHQQHEVDFGVTVEFTPTGGAVSVATTSTTSGADIIVTGKDRQDYVAEVYRVVRPSPQADRLDAQRAWEAGRSGSAMSVGGG